jgi:hypothetical protein
MYGVRENASMAGSGWAIMQVFSSENLRSASMGSLRLNDPTHTISDRPAARTSILSARFTDRV